MGDRPPEESNEAGAPAAHPLSVRTVEAAPELTAVSMAPSSPGARPQLTALTLDSGTVAEDRVRETRLAPASGGPPCDIAVDARGVLFPIPTRLLYVPKSSLWSTRR